MNDEAINRAVRLWNERPSSDGSEMCDPSGSKYHDNRNMES